jgi:hypothetical protein
LFGKPQDVAIDHLPGMSADDLDIAIQSRLFKSLVGNSDAAKSAQTLRVHNVKSKFFIGKSEKGFDNQTAQHLVGAHAFGTGALRRGFASVQILQNIPTNGRVCINKLIQKGEIECPEPSRPNKKGKRRRIKKLKSRNLLERLRDYEDDVLRFMENEHVAFTNNLGENDIKAAIKYITYIGIGIHRYTIHQRFRKVQTI